MRRAYWRLKYDAEVVAKLYQMRERGNAVRAAIKELAFQKDPWIGSLLVGEGMAWYEFDAGGCLIGFATSTDPEDIEPTLRIFYVLEAGR